MSEEAHTPKRHRSPSYPAIDLGKAVSRAEALYQHEGKYPAPVDAILAHWGYSGMNGRASRQLAAVKKFGLIDDEGSKTSRQVRLTDLGLRIVMPDSPERSEGLRAAAMKPAIHQELREKFSDGLPSDRNVRWYLVSERGFSEIAAKELITEYRATLRFAGLDGTTENGGTVEANDDSDGVGDPSQDEAVAQATAPPEEVQQPPQQPPTSVGASSPSALRDLTIPLAGTAWVKIAGEFPMAEESWDQMMNMLAAMKPGLTRADD
ncbi:MAG TPA: hypothetical protein VFZ29_08000 [Solirubrobacterales bacterium]